MPDPTLQLTFLQMQIRVADYLGIADRSGSSLGPPTDPKDLELVKRLVNDGYRRFITENENWNFMNVPLTVKFYPQKIYTITGATGTTIVVSSIAGQFPNGFFNGYEVTARDEDAGVDYPLVVTGYTGASGTFTFASVPTSAIEAGDRLFLSGPRNVAGMSWRIYMPDDFYGLWKQRLTFDETGPRVRIETVTEEQIRELRAGNRTSGTAAYVAFRPINTTPTSTGKRWEMLFWPDPTGSETVSGIYRRFPSALVNNTDVSVAGFHHDSTVLAAALSAAELFRHDRVGVHEQAYLIRLAASRKLDARATPRKNRPYGDASDEGPVVRPSSDYRPASYNGVPLD